MFSISLCNDTVKVESTHRESLGGRLVPFAGLEVPGEAILTSADEAGIGLGDLLRDGILSASPRLVLTRV